MSERWVFHPHSRPQAIIDGRTSLVGSDERRILQSLAAAPAQTVPVTLQVSEGLLIVTLPEQTDREALAVFAAAYLPHASTPVRRGENSGRTLEDFNIVRQFRLIGTWKGHAVVFRIPLQSFPMDTSQVAVARAARGTRTDRRKRGDCPSLMGAALDALRTPRQR